MKFPVQIIWITQLPEEQEELEIDSPLKEIQSMSKSKLKGGTEGI